MGQLVRESHGNGAALLGFSTDHGSVAAASDWDGPLEVKRVQPGLAGSWEALFHETGIARFALLLRGSDELAQALGVPRLQRAIGVIYRPETERQSHYFLARPAQQFDALVHLDRTGAVEPLDGREPHPPGERARDLALGRLAHSFAIGGTRRPAPAGRFATIHG